MVKLDFEKTNISVSKAKLEGTKINALASDEYSISHFTKSA